MPVDPGAVLDEMGLGGFPAGLGGCRGAGRGFEACGLDVVVFDGRDCAPSPAERGGCALVIHHASLAESRTARLLFYDGLRVIRDESWELRMLLARIRERRAALFEDSSRGSLVDALLCCQRALGAGDEPAYLASCWQKCASFHLADAIAAASHAAPGPEHLLGVLRGLGGGAGRHVPVATGSTGMERATPTLLARMAESAAGLAGLAGTFPDPSTIRRMHAFFAGRSMLADCYFYLGHASRAGFAGAPVDAAHAARVALDAGADPAGARDQARLVRDACNAMLESASGA